MFEYGKESVLSKTCLGSIEKGHKVISSYVISLTFMIFDIIQRMGTPAHINSSA